jgi:nucleotide-binding universal stress UspA family protein
MIRCRRCRSHTSTAPCAIAVAPRAYGEAHAFRRIAVAYDGSDESRDALDAARGLALFSGGSVHAYTVLEPCELSPALTTPGWAMPVSYEESRRARVEQVAAEVRLAPDCADVDAEVLIGHAGDALIALSRDFDLLVCGSRGYGALHCIALGGVSRAIVNEAGCPVLVLPRAPRHRLGWLRRHDAAAEV